MERLCRKAMPWLLLLVVLSLGMTNVMASEPRLPGKPAPATAAMPPMFLESTSPVDIAKTLDAFKAEVKAAGWTILGEHNMAGILSTKGYTLHPVIVIEICSGKYSAQLLARDETRYVTSMIPCRVAIYQTSDRKVIISRMNTAMFASMMQGVVAEVIKQSGSDVEAIIAKTLTQLK